MTAIKEARMNPIKGILITTAAGESSVSEVVLTDYKDYQRHIGGYIEVIPDGKNVLSVFCHEEGKILNLPENWLATAFCYAHTLLPLTDVIVGPLLVCGPVAEEGETLTVPDWVERALEAIVEIEAESRAAAPALGIIDG
jgi:hypothetical protein